jgi:hypothetical protein
MDMIVGLGRRAGEAEPAHAVPGISDRARTEAERRTVGRRQAPYPRDRIGHDVDPGMQAAGRGATRDPHGDGARAARGRRQVVGAAAAVARTA